MTELWAWGVTIVALLGFFLGAWAAWASAQHSATLRQLMRQDRLIELEVLRVRAQFAGGLGGGKRARLQELELWLEDGAPWEPWP